MKIRLGNKRGAVLVEFLLMATAWLTCILLLFDIDRRGRMELVGELSAFRYARWRSLGVTNAEAEHRVRFMISMLLHSEARSLKYRFLEFKTAKTIHVRFNYPSLTEHFFSPFSKREFWVTHLCKLPFYR